jgi:hypothetical protein
MDRSTTDAFRRGGSYKVAFSVDNQAGQSSLSPEVIFSTLDEEQPSSPPIWGDPSQYSVDQASIEVRWLAPTNLGGLKFKRYVVSFWEGSAKNPVVGSEVVVNVGDEGQASVGTSLKRTGLVTFTNYSFQIYAVTASWIDGGEVVGATSPVLTVATDRGNPGAFEFVDAPTSVVENDGSITFTVERVGGVGGAVQVQYE